jgi:hypothetical protein
MPMITMAITLFDRHVNKLANLCIESHHIKSNVSPPQDGNRHDHIVSRGAAKRRLEALRTLPDKPFLFIINFQIPGDPPVSRVTLCFFVCTDAHTCVSVLLA